MSVEGEKSQVDSCDNIFERVVDQSLSPVQVIPNLDHFDSVRSENLAPGTKKPRGCSQSSLTEQISNDLC